MLQKMGHPADVIRLDLCTAGFRQTGGGAGDTAVFLLAIGAFRGHPQDSGVPTSAFPSGIEACFHNGERHMKEKICRELSRLAKEIPAMTVEQAIPLLEGL